MAESNILGYTENTAPIGGDGLYLGDDLAGVPADNYLRLGNLNLLPDGFMVNGKISVTVASNNITVALKTLSGGNPSATDPVSIWQNGAFRRCTAALSVTVNAGVNTGNAGAAEFAAKEIDYFAYLIWNTTPATDIVDIGFSRIPSARVWSDFSATATNEKYCAHANASTPASTDAVCVIGRFAATLSAGAGYTWTVPTYTNTNLIQYPITRTRWLSYAPTITGFSAAPTNTVYEYMVTDENVMVRLHEATAGTSNSTSFSYTAPFTARTVTNGLWASYFSAKDNGAFLATPSLATIASAVNAITCFKDASSVAASWTGSSTKQCYYLELRYPIA